MFRTNRPDSLNTVLDLEFKGSRKMSKTVEAKKLRGRRLAVMAAGCISLALASLPGAALAQDTQTTWEGYATITAATPQCSSVDFATVNSVHVSIYRPKIMSTDLDTRLSILDLRAAIAFQNTSESTVHQLNGSGSYFGAHISSKVFFITYSGTYTLAVTPAPVIASTPSVTITGTIANVFNVAGCNVTLQGVYVRRSI